MESMVQYLERLARVVWERHYQLPEWGYWAALVTSGLLTIVGAGTPWGAIGIGVLAISVVGITRWHRDRKRCLGALIVPKFREGGGTEGHANEAQRILIDQLRNNLRPDQFDFVQPISVTVGSDEVVLAQRLQRRLRGSFVLHGRLAERAEGGWSVLPRILEPPAGATHWDPFTRDRTPANASFGPIVSRLPAQRGVRDEEFPFEFAKDLEALVRGVAGLVEATVGNYERATKLLPEAIMASGDSASWLVDSLRVALALAHADNGELEQGLDILRPRASGKEPSPHLLRGYAFLLSQRPHYSDEGRAEVEAVLRQALEVKGDPLRDQTVHNLMSLLGGPASNEENKEETEELLQELVRSSSGYRKMWYIKRALGLNAWLRGRDAAMVQNDDLAKAEGKQAAKWYARAIRARSRISGLGIGLRPPFVSPQRPPPSPILRANLRDAHELAGRRWRTNWHEFRFQRLRRRFMKTAEKAVEKGDFVRAYACFDWSVVGRRDDLETVARVNAAVVRRLIGQADEAEEDWAEALAISPFALIIRSALADYLQSIGVENGVPGDEPTKLSELKEFAPELFENVADETKAKEISG